MSRKSLILTTTKTIVQKVVNFRVREDDDPFNEK